MFTLMVIFLVNSLVLAEITSLKWDYNPPDSIAYEDAPMFVTFGWDDNSYADGVKWFVDFTDTLRNGDGSPVRSSYFITTKYGTSEGLALNQTVEGIRAAWFDAYFKGNEIANHTEAHVDLMSGATADAYWRDAIQNCNNFLINTIGVDSNDIVGFRAPFLNYGNGTFEVLKEMNFLYDCSIELGFNGYVIVPEIPGYTDPETGKWISYIPAVQYDKSKAGPLKLMWWPSTLDFGPPAGSTPKTTVNAPGMWELMPIVYHIPNQEVTDFDNIPDDFSVTNTTSGFDYNTWANNKIQTKEDYLNTMKLEFHQRYNGNRSPLTVNAHTDYYSVNYDDSKYYVKDYMDRRWVMEEFTKHILQYPEVRIVPMVTIIEWMQNPVKSSEYVAPTIERRDYLTPISDNNVSGGKKLNSSKITISETNVKLSVKQAGNYSVGLYSISGKRIANLRNGFMKAGTYNVDLKDNLKVSGVYLVRLTGDATSTGRIVIK